MEERGELNMAIYNYGLPINYQTPMPYQQQYPVQQTVSNTPITTNQSSSSGIIWVQGEAGAKAYPVAPGNSVLLMDSESECFYIKSTDSSGIPMPLRVFNYCEIVQSQPVEKQIDTSQLATQDDLEALRRELRQALDDLRPKTMNRKENKHEQTIPRDSAKQSNE